MSFESNQNNLEVPEKRSQLFGLIESIRNQINKFSDLFGQSLQTRFYVKFAFVSLCLSSIILFFLLLSIPRAIEQSRAIGELKFLNQMMINQTQQFENDPNDYAWQILLNTKQIFDRHFQNLKSIHFQNHVIAQADQLWNEASKDLTEAQLQKLQIALNHIKPSSTGLFIFISFLLFLTLLSFVFSVIQLFILRSQADREQLVKLVEQDRDNQSAIHRLLDEIGDLAEGDLTRYASVTEAFTGAIADAINVAIDQLRELVFKINQASEQVAQYTQKTQLISGELAQSSEQQTKKIHSTSSAIQDIVESIRDVSTNAVESAQVAQQSVQIASKGAEVVNYSIQGMDSIRLQIQDTSKRIKSLGESTQEIGNFVALIHEIADQTHLLALNAAIQASKAGESGRGFRLVADEVQRLAGRSALMTQQIDSLVKNILTDTHKAVSSMEQTTTEVVRGTRLTRNAGKALEDIQQVSKHLETLIANISNSSTLQFKSAEQIGNTMNSIQKMTEHNHTVTLTTAQSVVALGQMADSLKSSVDNFKLPN